VISIDAEPNTHSGAVPAERPEPRDELPPEPAREASTRLVGRTFASLRHRDFRIFYVGQLISVTGTWMQQVALGWFVLELTGSLFLLGVTSAVRSLPILLFSFVGGIAADRFDRKRIILVANCVALVVTAILAWVTAAGRVDMAGILLLAFALGVTNAFEMPARQAYVVELVGRGDLMNAIALNSLLFNGARVIGPAIAGVLVAAFGPAAAFGVNALSFIPVIVGLLIIHPPVVVRTVGRARAAFAETMAYLRGETRLAGLLLLLAASTIFASGYLVLGPAIARDLGQGPEGLGLLLSATGIGAIAAGLLLASNGHRQGRAASLVVAGLVMAACLVGVAISRSFALTLLLLGGTGWGMVTFNATSNTLIQTIVPDSLRGRTMSLYTIVMLGLLPVGSLLTGAVADVAGVSVALALGAIVWGTIVVVAFATSPRLRSL
jgi:MFS family permease